MMIDDIWKHCSTYGLTVASKSAQSGENAIFCHHSQNVTCYLESCCKISLSEMSMHKFWCNKKWWLDERLLGGAPFNNLKKETQILNIDYFAVELGCYASDLDTKDYQKVSPPELSEIEENECDSNSMAFSMALRSRSKKCLSYP